MNYSEPCDPYVTVNNTHTHFAVETFLDCNLTLDRVRDVLVKRGWMNADNYFLNRRFALLDKDLEVRKNLQGILIENVLSIGYHKFNRYSDDDE